MFFILSEEQITFSSFSLYQQGHLKLLFFFNSQNSLNSFYSQNNFEVFHCMSSCTHIILMFCLFVCFVLRSNMYTVKFFTASTVTHTVFMCVLFTLSEVTQKMRRHTRSGRSPSCWSGELLQTTSRWTGCGTSLLPCFCIVWGTPHCAHICHMQTKEFQSICYKKGMLDCICQHARTCVCTLSAFGTHTHTHTHTYILYTRHQNTATKIR